MAALFRIETCKNPSDLPRLTRELSRLLPPGEEPELRRTITILLLAVLRRTFPGVTIPKMVDLEDASMLEETALEWRKKDRREGRKEGRQEGMREVLLQLLERRFGPLAEEKRRRVEAITSPARLKRLADKILTAKSLQEMGI